MPVGRIFLSRLFDINFFNISKICFFYTFLCVNNVNSVYMNVQNKFQRVVMVVNTRMRRIRYDLVVVK